MTRRELYIELVSLYKKHRVSTNSDQVISNREYFSLMFTIYGSELASRLRKDFSEDFKFRLQQCLSLNLQYDVFAMSTRTLASEISDAA